MNREPEKEDLLNEVFAEPVSEEFREAMLELTVRVACRRRRRRQTVRAALATLVVLLTALLGHNLARRTPTPKQTVMTPVTPAYTLVRSRPLPTAARVVTRQDGAVTTVAMVPAESFRTTAHNLEIINDDQLLALLAPQPAVLVRLGPSSEELVLANSSEDPAAPSP